MKIERSIDIALPIETVWRIAQDPELRPQWDVRVSAYAVDGNMEDGAAVTVTWRTPVLNSVAEGRLLSVQAPHLAVVELPGATLPIFPAGTLTWELSGSDRGTRFTSRFEAAAADCAGPAWLIGFLIRRDLKRSLKNLRQLVMETVAAQAAVSPAGATA